MSFFTERFKESIDKLFSYIGIFDLLLCVAKLGYQFRKYVWIDKAFDPFEIIVNEFDPRLGPAVIGPGSKQQHHDVSKGFHCTRCGLKYLFIPPVLEKPESKTG